MIKRANHQASQQQASKGLWWILAATLAATVWSAMQSGAEQDFDASELVAPRKTSASTQPRISINAVINAENTQQPETLAWDKLNRTHVAAMRSDLFKPHSWAPPPVKQKPAPVPPPVAPPAPFQYVGKLDNTPQGTLIFLTNLNKLYSVKVGQKIDAQWRLDAENGQLLQFTYLPLNLPQSLSKLSKQAPVVAAAVPETQENL